MRVIDPLFALKFVVGSVGRVMQVAAEGCELLEVAKAHRGCSEPLFLLYRVRQHRYSVNEAHVSIRSMLTCIPVISDCIHAEWQFEV